ncbi:MAG: hypothetical protein NT131_04300 [Methanomassiliicoccales archaeon]|nr:hypothetical protein [Methanomassiliicoccales archaeon]
MEEDLDAYRIDEGYCRACLDLQGGREQRVYRFPNGYGASLISTPKLGSAPSWTVVALRFEGDEYEAIELPGVTNGSSGDWRRSIEALLIIKDRPHF